MGVYDTIHYKNKEYQTKSFSNSMLTYKVIDGNIFISTYKKNEDEGITFVGYKAIKFHGIIYIYNMDEEFFLKFNSGVFVGEVSKDIYTQNDGSLLALVS